MRFPSEMPIIQSSLLVKEVENVRYSTNTNYSAVS